MSGTCVTKKTEQSVVDFSSRMFLGANVLLYVVATAVRNADIRSTQCTKRVTFAEKQKSLQLLCRPLIF